MVVVRVADGGAVARERAAHPVELRTEAAGELAVARAAVATSSRSTGSFTRGPPVQQVEHRHAEADGDPGRRLVQRLEEGLVAGVPRGRTGRVARELEGLVEADAIAPSGSCSCVSHGSRASARSTAAAWKYPSIQDAVSSTSASPAAAPIRASPSITASRTRNRRSSASA